MWAPPTIVYVHGKSENVETKRKSTHICAQSFNILSTLSDYRSGILEKRVDQHWGTARETKWENQRLTLLCSRIRSSTMSSEFRDRLWGLSSSISSAERLPEIHFTWKSCNETEVAIDLFL